MRASIATLFVLLAAAPAAAQAPSSGYVRGFGGVSFMSETGGVFGGTVGLRVTPHVDVIGDVGRVTNILPRTIQRDLDAAASELGSYFGSPVTIDGKAPCVYGFGGVRLRRVSAQRVALFVEAGAGVARGTASIAAETGGVNVSREVVALLRVKHSETQPLFAIGGGVQVPLNSRLSLDLGYRFMRIFTDDPRIDTATMTAGFAWGF
jgi:opacity protein-like surface antigen